MANACSSLTSTSTSTIWIGLPAAAAAAPLSTTTGQPRSRAIAPMTASCPRVEVSAGHRPCPLFEDGVTGRTGTRSLQGFPEGAGALLDFQEQAPGLPGAVARDPLGPGPGDHRDREAPQFKSIFGVANSRGH